MITATVMSRFRWNFALWLDLPIGRTSWLTFGNVSDSGSLFRTMHQCQCSDFAAKQTELTTSDFELSRNVL